MEVLTSNRGRMISTSDDWFNKSIGINRPFTIC